MSHLDGPRVPFRRDIIVGGHVVARDVSDEERTPITVRLLPFNKFGDVSAGNIGRRSQPLPFAIARIRKQP